MSPEPLAVLRARTEDALAELDELEIADPAATEAVHALRLTAHTLRAFWVPVLDEALGRAPAG